MTIRGPLSSLPLQPFNNSWIEETWTWQYNLNLVAKDKLPNRQMDWPVPISAEPDPRRSWTWNYNLNLIGKDKFYGPSGYAPDFDYPNPIRPELDWRRSWEWSYNKNLIGKDTLPFRNQIPVPPPVQWYQSQESWYNLNLIGKDVLPIRSTDRPNPIGYEPDWRRSWTSSYVLELIGQDKLPNRQQDWPNSYPVIWYRSLEVNLLQTTLKLAPTTIPFLQFDWPNPQPVVWYRSQESWYNLNLIGKDRLPNRQQDWPVSYPVQWYQTWSQSPTPIRIPTSQLDWPLPQPIQWHRDWSQNLVASLLPPFRQQSWPLTSDIRDYRSWEYKYLSELIGQDTFPKNQKDWPLPYPVSWYQDHGQNLLQTTLFVSPGNPFSTNRNYDWPLPYPVTWYQFWSQSPAVPPVPVVITTTGGRQVGWDELERVERFSQAFLKDHNAPIPKFYNTNPSDPTIKARDAAVRLGRLGGIASGQARKK